MEARDVPAALTDNGIALVTYGGGADATVELIRATDYAPIRPTFDPFPGFRGAISAASGDVNGDGVPDTIVLAQGTGGLIAVYDGATGGVQRVLQLFPGFNGPVSVGTGDIDGDGYADILVSASLPGLPTGAVSGRDGSLLAAFLALPGSTLPTSVTGSDLNGDGRDEFVVGIGGAVGAFSAGGGLLGAVFPFPGSTGPVSVAGGDVNGDGIGDIVVGSPKGVPAEVKVYSGAGLGLIKDVRPFGAGVTVGIDVHVADGNGDHLRDVFASPQGGFSLALVPFYSTKYGYSPYGYFPQYGGGDNVYGTYSGYDSGSSGDVGGYDYSYTPSYDPGSSYTPSYDPGADYSSGSSYDPGSTYDSGGSYDSGDYYSDCGCY
jgi:hypothetical protein